MARWSSSSENATPDRRELRRALILTISSRSASKRASCSRAGVSRRCSRRARGAHAESHAYVRNNEAFLTASTSSACLRRSSLHRLPTLCSHSNAFSISRISITSYSSSIAAATAGGLWSCTGRMAARNLLARTSPIARKQHDNRSTEERSRLDATMARILRGRLVLLLRLLLSSAVNRFGSAQRSVFGWGWYTDRVFLKGATGIDLGTKPSGRAEGAGPRINAAQLSCATTTTTLWPLNPPSPRTIWCL